MGDPGTFLISFALVVLMVYLMYCEPGNCERLEGADGAADPELSSQGSEQETVIAYVK